MTISAKNLKKCISTMTFPVEVLAEKDDRVLYRLDRQQVEKLAESGAVVGIGPRNRVKRLRLNTLDRTLAIARKVSRESRLPTGPKYTYREKEMANQPHTLKRSVDGNFQFWPDDARFPQSRLNTDLWPTSAIGQGNVAWSEAAVAWRQVCGGEL
jgi:hypothetical protein